MKVVGLIEKPAAIIENKPEQEAPAPVSVKKEPAKKPAPKKAAASKKK